MWIYYSLACLGFGRLKSVGWRLSSVLESSQSLSWQILPLPYILFLILLELIRLILGLTMSSMSLKVYFTFFISFSLVFAIISPTVLPSSLDCTFAVSNRLLNLPWVLNFNNNFYILLYLSFYFFQFSKYSFFKYLQSYFIAYCSLFTFSQTCLLSLHPYLT